MNKIHTFIIEEHHEAFLVWNYAINNCIIPKENNVLYHFDEHADMNTPRFNSCIHDNLKDLGKLKEFTYRELSIADFIIPSVYLGIFNKVYWFKQRKSKKRRQSNYFVRSYNQQGKKLISGAQRELNIDDRDRKTFKYFIRNIEEVPSSNKKIILDIDLDYFSCVGDLNDIGEHFIQITKSEYDKFKKDRHNRLNYIGLNRVEAIKRDSKYYYLINYFEEIYPNALKVDEYIIKERIKLFGRTLKVKSIKPQLITICRSRHSGYTPGDQWSFIQKELIQELKRIYNLSILQIEKLLDHKF